MTIKLHNLLKGDNKKKKRVGRGNASGHGTYSTRGQKGQKSRSGVSGLKLKGMKHIILSTPKLKGFKSRHAGKSAAITFEQISRAFKDGDLVNPSTLLAKRIIKAYIKSVKIISSGELTVKVDVEGCKLSESAKKTLEEKGGTVKPKLAKKKPVKKKTAKKKI